MSHEDISWSDTTTRTTYSRQSEFIASFSLWRRRDGRRDCVAGQPSFSCPVQRKCRSEGNNLNADGVIILSPCTQHLLYWWYTEAKNTSISSLSNKTFTWQFDRVFEFCSSWRWSREWKIKHIIMMNSCRPTLVWLQFITCHFRSGIDFWGLNPTKFTCVWGSGVFPAERQQTVFVSLLFQHDSLSFETTRSSSGCQKHILQFRLQENQIWQTVCYDLGFCVQTSAFLETIWVCQKKRIWGGSLNQAGLYHLCATDSVRKLSCQTDQLKHG